MRFFPVLVFVAVLPVLIAAEPVVNALTPEESANGWILLFDGTNAAAHWRGYRSDSLPEEWTVEGDALVCRGGGDIVTREQFENFELSIEWKISEGGNSGIKFKVKETDRPAYATGPEAQILDNVRGRDPQKAGWLYQLYAADTDTTRPAGKWNHFVLKCQRIPAGTYRCEHWMNGQLSFDYEIGSDDWKARLAKSKFADWPGFGEAASGHIALQDHGDPVWFRNVKIRNLPERD